MDLDRLEAGFRNRTPEVMDAQRGSAVLVPLVKGEEGLCLLYEVRAKTLRHQPGEICFPGGRMEGEESPAACALRETWEELGIPPEAVRVLGPLDFVAHRSGRIIHAVLGLVEAETLERLAPNPAEVEETFLVPLADLWDRAPMEASYPLVPAPEEDFPYEALGIPRHYPWANGRERVLSYRWGDRVIWGLTGRITRNLIQLMKELRDRS